MLQIASNTFVSFCLLLLLGLGFGLVYRTTKILDVSFAGTICCGCYVLYFLTKQCGQNYFISVPPAIIVAVCLAIVLHFQFTFNRSVKNISLLGLFLASLGAYAVLQNAIAISFGNDRKVILQGPVVVGHRIWGAYLTNIQLITVVTGVILFCGVLLLANRTRLGRMIRGVSAEPDLSRTVGVSVSCIRLWAVGIGTGIGTVAAILSALDTGMIPTMGFRLLLDGMVVMMIGGQGNFSGLIGSAFLLAATQNLTAYYFGSRWTDAVTFVVLIGFLVCKSSTFSGLGLKKAEV